MLRKGCKLEWSGEHTELVRKMKEALAVAPALRKAVYGKGVPVYVTVDTSPTRIGWVINQGDENGMRLPIRSDRFVLIFHRTSLDRDVVQEGFGDIRDAVS